MFIPMTINIKNKKFLIVGGGKVALRKVRTLLEYDADIVLVSPKLEKDLFDIKDSFKWIDSNYEKSLLFNMDFVITASNDEKLNDKIQCDCTELKIQCLNVSSGLKSDFHIPAIIKRDKISISISTQGHSPGLSKQLKNDINEWLDDEWIEKLENISVIRKLIINNIDSESEKKEIMRELITLSLSEIKQRRQQYENQNWI